jgi:hypothetical protein
MARPIPLLPTRRYERGGVSWVTVLLLAAVVGAVYLVIAWAPIYIVHYEVKQVVRDHMNQAIKDRNDAPLVERMCAKLASLHQETLEDASGVERRVPVVQVTPTDVTWERDTTVTPPVLHVAFEYVREVRYPYLDRVSEWVGSVDFTQELAVPDWGPAR